VGFEKLGTPCQGADTVSEVTLEAYTGRASCGANGTVSQIEWRLADVVGAPAESEAIAERTESGAMGENTVLRITANAVWMRNSRPTRRVTGWTFMGVPEWMTDKQRAEAQRLAKLRDAPPLASAEAWKAALIQSGPIPPPAP
jgi:hypothetical protein